jgi:DHA3 family macrolide efflux protein-like MFS transporter
VLQATGSVFDVGLVVVATLLPVVVLGPLIGVYVDRWPRRTVLIATNVGEGVLVAALSGLVLTHAANLGVILGIVLALATGAQVVRVASNAIVPQTVRTEDLAPANSLLSFSNSFNQIVGLSIGGVVVALFGVTLPIEYDALSFFAAAVILGFMSSAVGLPERAPEGADSKFVTQFKEGLRFVREQRFLVEIIILGVALNFFGNSVAALWAPYAKLVLHGNASTYGFLGAAIAAGAIVGAAFIGTVDTRRSAGKYLFLGVAGAGALILALGATQFIPFAFAESFALGVMLSIGNIPIVVLIQAKVPNRLMGRVMAVLMSLVLAASPLGALFAGSFAAVTSVAFVFIVSGIVVVSVAALGAVVMQEIRTITY